ncbi:hypothetical protein Ahy_A04g020370 [Arachis hypogaea]|uniref:Uncharacterized protein n=1 Tax=Arachis hypogaea TaxID=3818 RepID=A0A445DHK9_ARAHY|nr:hypothetical protein Ahy_A04g020370 [Arachis hypogaea]
MLAFDGSHRWGHMTTNLVEYINPVLKRTHNHFVTAIVKSTFCHINKLFTWRSVDAHERIGNGLIYSEFATQQVEERNIVMNRFDRHNQIFEVHEMSSDFHVTTFLHVAPTSVLIDKLMYMICTRCQKFTRSKEESLSR